MHQFVQGTNICRISGRQHTQAQKNKSRSHRPLEQRAQRHDPVCPKRPTAAMSSASPLISSASRLSFCRSMPYSPHSRRAASMFLACCSSFRRARRPQPPPCSHTARPPSVQNPRARRGISGQHRLQLRGTGRSSLRCMPTAESVVVIPAAIAQALVPSGAAARQGSTHSANRCGGTRRTGRRLRML